jgi:hypothetical protein
MSNARNKYLDEEWEKLERKVLKKHNKQIDDFLLANTSKETQLGGGYDFYMKSEVGIRLPRPNPNKVYFNRGTKEIFDEYDTLLGYGEVLGEVFKLQ